MKPSTKEKATNRAEPNWTESSLVITWKLNGTLGKVVTQSFLVALLLSATLKSGIPFLMMKMQICLCKMAMSSSGSSASNSAESQQSEVMMIIQFDDLSWERSIVVERFRFGLPARKSGTNWGGGGGGWGRVMLEVGTKMETSTKLLTSQRAVKSFLWKHLQQQQQQIGHYHFHKIAYQISGQMRCIIKRTCANRTFTWRKLLLLCLTLIEPLEVVEKNCFSIWIKNHDFHEKLLRFFGSCWLAGWPAEARTCWMKLPF